MNRRTVYCFEPASFEYSEDGCVQGRLVANPGAWSQHRCGGSWPARFWGSVTCVGCGQPLAWKGPPRRLCKLWVYVVDGCGCRRRNVVASPWRLVVGGVPSWWEEQGWWLRT